MANTFATMPPLPQYGAWVRITANTADGKAVYAWLQSAQLVLSAAVNLTLGSNSVANAALVIAQNAYTQANIATGLANVGITIGNQALAQANVANALAQSAFVQANLAYSEANLANSVAQSAFIAANAAANTVATYLNGTLILANANLNFNTSATTNISAVANGSTQVNISVNVNASSLLLAGAVSNFAGLPAGTQGLRGFITDANSNVFYSSVSGGGANALPVFFDGTIWRVG